MKLQPNFSWQKYEGKPEDQKEQFQYQLQQQHIVVSNSVNATIDDLSFWTRERQTSYTWVDSKPVYTKTVALVAWTVGGTVNTFSLGISGAFKVINIMCVISDGTTTLPVPNVDFTTPANELSIAIVSGTVTITSNGTDMSAFTGYVTIYYTK
jgi:hypothetical protein